MTTGLYVRWLCGPFSQGPESVRHSAMPTNETATVRPLFTIAADIRRTWPKVYFGAVPYLDAMASLNKITDKYGYDDADEIVMYFLSNATTWRGDDARRVKAELRAMLAEVSRR